MLNLTLIRVDERLIHGQILTQWLKRTEANLIVVANDEVSTDELRQNLMNVAIPSGVSTRYFSLDKTCSVIHKASSQQRILLLVANLTDLLYLIKGGVPIQEVNIGNIHPKQDSLEISPSVSLSINEFEILNEMNKRGIKCIIQRMPSETPIDIYSYLKTL